MTPAEELREAAQRIRDLAAKATPGPWINVDKGDRIIRDPDATAREDDSDPCGAGPPLEYVVDEPLFANPDNGAHIALFDPVVAEATAYMLMVFADKFEDIPPVHEEQTRAEQAVLSLARAINEGATDER